jgi:hypothetical protein
MTKIEIFMQKLKLIYPLVSITDAQLQEKPSALKTEHTALQNIKLLYFFLFLWVTFALLDPDLATYINEDPKPCPLQRASSLYD